MVVIVSTSRQRNVYCKTLRLLLMLTPYSSSSSMHDTAIIICSHQNRHHHHIGGHTGHWFWSSQRTIAQSPATLFISSSFSYSHSYSLDLTTWGGWGVYWINCSSSSTNYWFYDRNVLLIRLQFCKKSQIWWKIYHFYAAVFMLCVVFIPTN